MLRSVLPVSLLTAALALPAPAGAQALRGVAPALDSARSHSEVHHDGRFGRTCSCTDHLRHLPSCGDGRVARHDPPERARGADSARTVVHRRHGENCACLPCRDGRRDDGDTIIIIAPSASDRAPGVVIRDRDSTRVLLDAVSVRKPRRTDGVLAASGAGGDVLVRGASGPTVRDDGDPFVPARGAIRTVRAGSGDLYVHVRADGSLEIRRR